MKPVVLNREPYSQQAVSLSRYPKLLALTSLLAIILSLSTTIPKANAVELFFDTYEEGITTGGGSLGPGSIVFAAFFSAPNNNGVATFAGTINNHDQAGEIKLTHQALIRTTSNIGLQCPSSQAIALTGPVTTGSLQGQQFVALSCIGFGAPTTILFLSTTSISYLARGTATTVTLKPTTQTTTVIAATTSGSGPAGSGSIFYSAFYTTAVSKGVDGFSGMLGGDNVPDVPGEYDLAIAPAPPLPCGTNPQVAFTGPITSGPLRSQEALLYGCVGNNLPGAMMISSTSGTTYAGTGSDYCVQYRETDF